MNRWRPILATVALYAIQLSAYGLVCWGAWGVYPPLGPLSVGAMVWFDLHTGAK